MRFKHAAIFAAIACAAAYLPRTRLVAALLGSDCPTNPAVQTARRALAHLGAESDCRYVQISGSLNQGRSHGVYVATGECNGKTHYECSNCYNGSVRHLTFYPGNPSWSVSTDGCDGTQCHLELHGQVLFPRDALWHEPTLKNPSISVACLDEDVCGPGLRAALRRALIWLDLHVGAKAVNFFLLVSTGFALVWHQANWLLFVRPWWAAGPAVQSRAYMRLGNLYTGIWMGIMGCGVAYEFLFDLPSGWGKRLFLVCQFFVLVSNGLSFLWFAVTLRGFHPFYVPRGILICIARFAQYYSLAWLWCIHYGLDVGRTIAAFRADRGLRNLLVVELGLNVSVLCVMLYFNRDGIRRLATAARAAIRGFLNLNELSRVRGALEAERARGDAWRDRAARLEVELATLRGVKHLHAVLAKRINEFT